MFHEVLAWLLGIAIIAAFVVESYRRRLQRAHLGHRRLEEYADTMLQHMQGTLLHVQGIINELRAEDPVRQRVESALERADLQLAEIREQMQPHCSEQQERRIR